MKNNLVLFVIGFIKWIALNIIYPSMRGIAVWIMYTEILMPKIDLPYFSWTEAAAIGILLYYAFDGWSGTKQRIEES